MKQSAKLSAGALGIILLGSLISADARAQCGGPLKVGAQTTRAIPGAALRLAALSTPNPELAWGDERDVYGMEPIVGLWKQELIDPAQGYGDKGYTSWHNDHTEFLNSERTPSTGAVCQGVWAKVGRSQYQLNHYALAFGDDVHLTNVIRIRELVTVDPSHNTYRGRFTVTIYDTQHTQLAQFKGVVTGERVRIDTGIDSQ